MNVLLTDASSLTSRQLATILSRAGHTVHLLSPPGAILTRLTCHVSTRHLVPVFGDDPYKWLEGALSIIDSARQINLAFDVLICTQEQVTVISAELNRVLDTGIHVAVPSFESLRKVMDKIFACTTLENVGLKQPESIVLSSASNFSIPSSLSPDIFPAYAKLPIATGSTGVHRVTSIADLKDIMRGRRLFERGGKLLLQKEVPGPLLMICGIFSHGSLLAWHACVRTREGVNGGGSVKVSCPLPIVEVELAKLGQALKWHGALSADEWKHEKEVVFIDINPRIVEPMNGLLAGVDLVDVLMNVSLDKDDPALTEVEKPKVGKEGVQTHQLILALLAAAKEGRVSLVKELWMAFRGWHSGDGMDFMGTKEAWRSLHPS
ncbi:hypothetical protein D0Z07_0775 [Hyphodiscus hymeniophilus]|uniref:ATP-grasp domain-containing protein n=1 Tax=Hyphodiscus hymeniophilus TaxID=353542 RepID=A0A9P6VQ46_9HELO|nr:hypothetical protein D0Z07_0775 [Hyphodiscus hymeniophilus]